MTPGPQRWLPLLVLISTTLLPAHQSVQQAVSHLTAQIQLRPTADLHYQRGTKYRALHHPTEAAADFRATLQLDPTHRPALLALATLKLGHPVSHSAIATLLTHSSTPSQKREALLLKTRAFLAKNDLPSANQTIARVHLIPTTHDQEAYLLHQEILTRLNRPAEAAALLKARLIRNPASIVLRNTWIDTAISAGQPDEVRQIIEEEISTSRFRASWLIRRARIKIFESQDPTSDLRTALAELSTRIRPERPDLTLIADRALANALLGQTQKALKDLKTLQASTLPPRLYQIAQDQLQSPPKD